MSLDFYLEGPPLLVRDKLFEANATHNLIKMAEAAGVYQALWRPDENNISKASDIIEILEKGLLDLHLRPEYYKQFNPTNSWGNYEIFVDFVEKCLQGCKDNPESIVRVWR